LSAAQICNQEPKTLEVAGVYCSTIDSVSSSPLTKYTDILEIARNVGSLYGMFFDTGESLLDMYAWTLSLVCLQRWPVSKAEETTNIECFEHIRNVLVSRDRLFPEVEAFKRDWPIIYDLDVLKGRRFFSTMNGYIGFGPRTCQAGMWIN